MDFVIFFFTSLALILDLLQLKYNGTNMFQQHPLIAGIMVISLIMYGFLLGFQKYGNYFGNSDPFFVNLLGCLSITTTISLLLPVYVRPLVFIVSLFIPSKKALYWIFTKMDERFGETEFWMTRVDPVLCYMRRRLNRETRNIMPILPF
ncbi:hypothetical protein KY290_033050 [Solanum tuberosum]|uniref:Uncharacterized protein n=1 Tax=Solanum tuberosum TaxID=4113 RepID=A0ABQ7TZ53_SOLTU|nr:hypothetical protein KY290_033050 [Solanum tuberosum]